MDDLTGQIVGGYRLTKQIGEGGMSTVYIGVNDATGSQVAVKLLSSYIAQEPRFRARFAREVKLLKKLSGCNIVPILGYGDEDGFTYIVMPYITGGTLQDKLYNGGMELRETARIIQDVTTALAHAHRKGIIHRDVKPSNILLDESGSALLSDFGFAYVNEQPQDEVSHSLTGSVLIGTPAFMSPEQCKGEEIDARSDQYSLGAVLFLVTTGSLPYEAPTPMGVVVKHIHDPLPRPRSFNPYLPDAIEDVVQTAMAKEPEDRYPSIEDMNEAYQGALVETLDPESGLPRPESLGPAPQTAVLELGSRRRRGERTPLWSSGRTSLALAFVIMLMLPLAAWAVTGRIPGANGAAAAAEPSSTLSADLLATIDALSTENAAALGEAVGPEQIQSAVAGTVEAMGLTATASVTPSTATPTPTLTPTPTVRYWPTSGGGGSGDEGGGSGGPPAPSSTPAPTRTPSSTPGPSATSGGPPTGTTVPPTSTSAVPPTSTPAPPVPTDPPEPTIDPGRCKDNPNNPWYCTPTP